MRKQRLYNRHLWIVKAKMDSKELIDIKDFLVSIAQEAGAMIMAAKPTNDASGSKKNSM